MQIQLYGLPRSRFQRDCERYGLQQLLALNETLISQGLYVLFPLYAEERNVYSTRSNEDQKLSQIHVHMLFVMKMYSL